MISYVKCCYECKAESWPFDFCWNCSGCQLLDRLCPRQQLFGCEGDGVFCGVSRHPDLDTREAHNCVRLQARHHAAAEWRITTTAHRRADPKASRSATGNSLSTRCLGCGLGGFSGTNRRRISKRNCRIVNWQGVAFCPTGKETFR